MSLYTLLGLAVALGTDAFSLCLGLGLAGVTRRQIVLITVSVLIFHIVMPLLGWLAGDLAGALLGRAAGIGGGLLLIYLGVKMIRSSLQSGEALHPQIVLVNTWGLLALSAGVSMDALSVGFSLGAKQVNLALTAMVIGVTAGLMTAAGLILGRFVSARLGAGALAAGGVILIGIGLHMVIKI